MTETQQVHVHVHKQAPTQGVAIVGLLLNLLFWPGLGTLVGGRIAEGIIQGFLFLGGLILTITLIGAIIGIPMMIAGWIWALISGIQMINAASMTSQVTTA